MKARITDRDARDCVSLSIWYGNAQYLLRAYNPIYYTCWIYGRKSDIYEINWIYIATWYWPVWRRADYNLTREYDKKAKKIRNNYDIDYNKRAKKVEKLLTKFLILALNENLKW